MSPEALLAAPWLPVTDGFKEFLLPVLDVPADILNNFVIN